MATHSGTLAWKIPWTEKPGRLQSMGSQRVGHNWATSLFTFSFTLLCNILQWLPNTWKIKSSLYTMLYSACVIWPLLSYRLLSLLDFRHSGLYESSHNTRNVQAFVFASLCLSSFPQICAEPTSSLLSGLCPVSPPLQRPYGSPWPSYLHYATLLPHLALVFFPELVPPSRPSMDLCFTWYLLVAGLLQGNVNYRKQGLVSL